MTVTPTIIIGAALLSVGASWAYGAPAGGQGGGFLQQEAGARGAALGGAMTALTDDTASLLWNPAGLARLSKPEGSATHVTLFEDTNYDYISAGFPMKRWGGFAGAYVRQSSGGFERRANPNDSATQFAITQSAWLGGWGISLPYADVGIAAKSVKESIDPVQATGAGADAGVIVRVAKGLSFGVRAGNLLAPRLTFLSSPIRYARTYDFSPAYTWSQGKEWKSSVAFKLSKTENASAEPSGGVELTFRRQYSLRLGMQSKGLSTGLGVRFGNTQVDYAAVLHSLGVSHMVSLLQRFGHTREELEETIRAGISALTRSEGVRLAKAYIQKAEDELAQDRIQSALRDFEAASLLDPSNQSLKDRIARVTEKWDLSLRKQMIDRTAALALQHQSQGNLLAARQYWKSVQELDPNYAPARDYLKQIDRTLSRDERAKVEELRKAQNVNELQQILAVAASYLSRGKFRQARLEAENASARFPNAPDLVVFAGRARRELADFVTAKLFEAERLASSRNFAEALRAIDVALREDPDNLKLKERAAELRGQLQRAQTPETRRQVEQLYYRAVEQYLKGDLPAAGKLADEIMHLDPGYEAARTLKEKIEAAARYGQ